MERRVCAWCPHARGAARVRRASHGICPPCLRDRLAAERSGRGARFSGPRFYVWDLDARTGLDWAAELAASDRAARAPRERERVAKEERCATASASRPS